MIRAVFFGDTPHRLAGAQRSLIGALSVIGQFGVDPTVIVPCEGIFADACRQADLPVCVVPAPPAFQVFGRALTRMGVWAQLGVALRQAIPYARQLARTIEREHADVLHVNTLRGAVMTGLAAPLSGRNAVLHVRGLPDIAFPYWLVAQAIPNRFVMVSHALDHHLLPSLRSRARVVHDGIRVRPRIPREAARRAIRDRWGLSSLENGVPVFLTLSSLAPFKGLHHLLAAAAETTRRGVHAVFLLAGPAFGDAYGRWLHRRCHDLDLAGRVHFLDFVDDVHELLCAADAFVLPSVPHEHLDLGDGTTIESRCNEGLPRSILEAMAAKLPVIATRLGGVPEQVDDGVSGLLVPGGDARRLSDALCRIVDDRPWCARAGQRGREIVLTRFTEEAAARGLADVLRAAAGERSRMRQPLEYARFCRDGISELLREAAA